MLLIVIDERLQVTTQSLDKLRNRCSYLFNLAFKTIISPFTHGAGRKQKNTSSVTINYKQATIAGRSKRKNSKFLFANDGVWFRLWSEGDQSFE